MENGDRGREINIETWRDEEKDNEKESKEERKKRLVEKRWSDQVNCHNGRLEKRGGSSYIGDGKFPGGCWVAPLYLFASHFMGSLR